MTAPPRPFRRRIGEILVSDGVCSAEQVEEALVIQRKTGEMLGQILMSMGAVSEADIARTLSLQFQLPFLAVANYEFDDKLVSLFPKEFLHKHKILPFDKIGEMLLVLVAEIPTDEVLAEIPKLTRLNAALYVGYLSEIERCLAEHCPLEARGDGPKGKPQAGAKAGAAGPKTAALAASKVKIHNEDDEDESGAEDDVDSEDDDGDDIVFGGSKQSFMEELDSTWDSIFEESKGKGKPGGGGK
jgi:hypothetical protein